MFKILSHPREELKSNWPLFALSCIRSQLLAIPRFFFRP